MILGISTAGAGGSRLIYTEEVEVVKVEQSNLLDGIRCESD
uniref:Uncharacterized protein n=1 Tax=Heterorhabditis bacteriophora TaxID=37862 RepID=A0A1I7XC95_HETBA